MAIDRIAFRQWQQDVLQSLGVQWALLVVASVVSGLFGFNCAVNTLLAGLAIAVPNTALGAWMGVRLWLGKVDALGVLVGVVVKTLFSVVLIGAVFTALQTIGWVWQGFLAGLVSTVFAPTVFGLWFKRAV